MSRTVTQRKCTILELIVQSFKQILVVVIQIRGIEIVNVFREVWS